MPHYQVTVVIQRIVYTLAAVMLQHLKRHRIKADLRNDEGFTPLHIACSQGHVHAARLVDLLPG